MAPLIRRPAAAHISRPQYARPAASRRKSLPGPPATSGFNCVFGNATLCESIAAHLDPVERALLLLAAKHPVAAIDWSVDRLDFTAVDDEMLLQLAAALRKSGHACALKKISLAGSYITGAGLAALMAAAKGLSRLDISRCENLSDEDLAALHGAPALATLDLGGLDITVQGIRLLASCAPPRLETLRLDGCKVDGDTVAEHLSAFSRSLRSVTGLIFGACGRAYACLALPLLETLHLRDDSLPDVLNGASWERSLALDLHGIEDGVLARLVANPAVVDLHIRDSEDVTCAGLTALNLQGSRLQDFSMWHCGSIDGDGLAALGRCPGLRKLRLSSLNDAALCRLPLLPALTHLDVSYSNLREPESFAHIARIAPALRTLNASGAPACHLRLQECKQSLAGLAFLKWAKLDYTRVFSPNRGTGLEERLAAADAKREVERERQSARLREAVAARLAPHRAQLQAVLGEVTQARAAAPAIVPPPPLIPPSPPSPTRPTSALPTLTRPPNRPRRRRRTCRRTFRRPCRRRWARRSGSWGR